MFCSKVLLTIDRPPAKNVELVLTVGPYAFAFVFDIRKRGDYNENWRKSLLVSWVKNIT